MRETGSVGLVTRFRSNGLLPRKSAMLSLGALMGNTYRHITLCQKIKYSGICLCLVESELRWVNVRLLSIYRIKSKQWFTQAKLT